MDAEIFSVTAGAAFISTLLFGLATLRSVRRTPRERRTLPGSLTLGAALCTVGSLCAVPAIEDSIEGVTHIDNVGRLGAHLCGIGLCAGLRAAMTEWTHGVDCRGRAALLRMTKGGLVAATAIAIFATHNRCGLDFTSSFARDRGVAAYLGVVYAYGLWVGATTATTAGTLAVENLRSTEHRALGLGQAILGVGGAACVVYTAAEAAFLLSQQVFGRAWALSVEQTLSSLCAGLFMFCSFVGLILSSVARPLLAALKR
ncbi:hypothetical protein AB0D10_00670 [Kitasatospora sp. NPDC048545]|uniref:hypothetical protein n=1 Tax=Kitasatospora sp. NPDC048545 TaxID=3157208 RepID=UPI0033D1AD94